MLLNSQSKDGSLKDVRAEYAKYILGKWGLYSHQKLVFKEKKLKYYHYYHTFVTSLLF